MGKILLFEQHFTDTAAPDRIEQALLALGHDVISFPNYLNFSTAWKVECAQSGDRMLEGIDAIVADVRLPPIHDGRHIGLIRTSQVIYSGAFTETPIIAFELGDTMRPDYVRALGANEFAQLVPGKTFESDVVPLLGKHVPQVPGKTGNLKIYNPVRAPA